MTVRPPDEERRVAVAIGVATVRGSLALRRLRGTTTGCDAFLRWAGTQGFETVRHVDDERPVRLAELLDTIESIVAAGDVRRLFVYFAGHGHGVGMGDALWLLSDALTRSGEAVEVTSTVQAARVCGVPHVAFFADTCRTPPDRELVHVVGLSMFPAAPIRGVDGRGADVDQFHATLPGDPAWEQRTPDGDGHGLFTDCLLEALDGHAPGVLTPVRGRLESVVEARKLRDHLHETVPLESDRRTGRVQLPDCIPGSYWEPDALSWVGPQVRAPEPMGRRPGHRPVDPGRLGQVSGARDAAVQALTERYTPHLGRSRIGVRLEVQGRGRLLSVRTGREVRDVTAWRGGRPLDVEVPTTGLVRLRTAAGITALAAVLLVPGTSTTLVPGDLGIEHIAMIHARPANEVRHEPFAGLAPRVGARLAASLRMGDYRVLDDGQIAELVRAGDLTVAVLAAHGLHRLGRANRVVDIADSLTELGGIIPYDVALLSDRLEQLGDRVRPNFPLLRRGWSLLGSSAPGPAALEQLRNDLLPATWTSFADNTPDDSLASLLT